MKHGMRNRKENIMYQVKIERHEYETGLNRHKAVSFQAHVEDEYGTWIEEAPVRDTWDQANDDARLMREALRERR